MKIQLFAEAGILVDDNIYFFSSKYNILYKVHMPDFLISIISHIPCGKINAFEWFRKMRYWNGKLIFIPSYAEKIWIYDLDSHIWDSININYPEYRLKFWGSVIYKDSIFLFGVLYPVILKVNLNDYDVSYLKIRSHCERKKGEEGLFLTEAVRKEHMIFCPSSITNQVLKLNLDTLEYEWLQIGNEGNRYSGIDYDGKFFWISSGQSGKIVKWDGYSKWTEYDVPEKIADRSYQFIGVVCDKDRIRFLTQQDGESLEIVSDLSGKEQVVLTKKTKRYVHVEDYEDGTIVLMQSDAHMDVKWKGKWIQGICAVSHKEFAAYFCETELQEVLKANGMVNEAEIFMINDFVKMIGGQTKTFDKWQSEDVAGINIWKTVK